MIGSHDTCGPLQFEVVTGDGRRFEGRTDSHIDWHVFFFGCYDPLGIKLLQHLASQMDCAVVLDIGANVGTHTLAIAGLAQQVHAFEPYPIALKRLKNHIEGNGLDNVQVHEFGLSTETTVSRYFENSAGNFGAGSFEVDHANVLQDTALELPLRQGDQALRDLGIEKIDLIKIDVEGHESLALTGLKQTLERDRPIGLDVEAFDQVGIGLASN